MNRCPDQVVSLKRDPQCFKSPSKLDTPLSAHSSKDERLSRSCPVPSRHGGTLNSRRAASPFVRLAKGEERWEAPDHTPRVSPSKLG
ncbi:hypothetical protein TNCV_3290651 [Trichonephila clavipes]|nr:hypothetical protein TNCV_3290651 [Trichonephila clavipes]